MRYYKISASNGDSVETILTGLSADADLYVKIGEKPTTDTFDCSSEKGETSNESCSVTLNNDADVYIGVYGYESSSYQLESTIVLTSGNAVYSSVAQGEMKYYKIAVQNNQTLTPLLSELNDDLDLYVKIGSKPTLDNNDCHSGDYGTNDESCSLTLNSGDEDIYIGVHGYHASSYKLEATIE